MKPQVPNPDTIHQQFLSRGWDFKSMGFSGEFALNWKILESLLAMKLTIMSISMSTCNVQEACSSQELKKKKGFGSVQS